MMLGNNYNGEQVIETGSLRANGDGDIVGVGGGGNNGGVQLKKGPWTAAEDAILTEYVRKHGEGNWNAVQRNTGLARCGKSCRLRWANHLRPNLKKGAFSPEEERIIVELHAQLGNKWARMAAQLPGRTDNEIKNYWNTRVKRRHRQGLPLYPPDVQPQHKHHHHHHQHQHQLHHQFSQQFSHPSSHSHHVYHSLPSTPTTPTSSFSFQTTHTTPSTPTSGHHHHHHHHHPNPHNHQLHHYQFAQPCHSPTPPPLSPTPPPLSPNLHSPTFPTLTLFGSNAANAQNNNNNNTINPNNINNSPFNVPRAPPILQAPVRFKRFHADPSVNDNAAASNNNTITNNNNNGSVGPSNYANGNFSLPFSPFVQTSQQSPLPSPQANSNNAAKLYSHPSFSSNFVDFNPGSSSPNVHTQFEKDCGQSNNSVFSIKQELPSSQLLSQNNNNNNNNNNNGGNSGMTFDNSKVINHDNMSSSGSGLLEDLLEEAQAMANNYGESSRNVNAGTGSMEEKCGFSGFNPWNCSGSGSGNLSSGMKPKEEAGAEQMNNMQEDLSKLLNVIPSMQVPEWYNDSGEASNCQSSVVTDDNLGLEMQQIASLFNNNNNSGGGQVRNTNSCSIDNLPGLC